MFIFLVALGFGSSMLFSMVPWEHYANCFENGMVPDISSKEKKCIEISTPQAFGETYYPPPLKQIKAGTALIDIKCNDDKIVVYKRDRMSAACVTAETESELIFKRGWATMRLGHPATDNLPRDLCGFYQGQWITEYKECERLEDPLQCSLMGGVYNECASACRNAPEYPNVVCTDNCVEVCKIEFSTLEDIKNHHLVTEFYAKYPDAYEEVRSDHISYVAGSDDGFKVRMNLYFNEDYTFDNANLKCYVNRALEDDVSGHFISKYLENYECEKDQISPQPKPEPENEN